MYGRLRTALVLSTLLCVAVSLSSCGTQRPRSVTPSSERSSTPAPSAEATLPPGEWPTLDLALKWTGFDKPLYVANAGDGTGRLFVVEQTGKVIVVDQGQPLAKPFLDVSDRITSGGEQGLLSVAFPKSFKTTGRFYAYYTDRNGDTAVARYIARPGENVADAGSEHIVLRVKQPFPNHNGGQLQFGPDGYLYVGLGDGGSEGDPQDNGQRRDTLLGKILRIDVEGAKAGRGYAIPGDNPFAAGGPHPVNPPPKREIWAYGLRNPWRFSFDRKTGEVYIGDVGQDAWEEIDFMPRLEPVRLPSRRRMQPRLISPNFGWKLFEGTHSYPSGTNHDPRGTVMPVAEYSHALGEAVTGGYVYRGKGVPEFDGIYFYGDYGSGRIWGMRRENGAWKTKQLAETNLGISSFGEDEEGEVYVCDINQGGVYILTR